MIARAADGAPALVGSDRESGKDWFNSLIAVAPDGSIAAIYDKSRLVPSANTSPGSCPSTSCRAC